MECQLPRPPCCKNIYAVCTILDACLLVGVLITLTPVQLGVCLPGISDAGKGMSFKSLSFTKGLQGQGGPRPSVLATPLCQACAWPVSSN